MHDETPRTPSTDDHCDQVMSSSAQAYFLFHERTSSAALRPTNQHPPFLALAAHATITCVRLGLCSTDSNTRDPSTRTWQHGGHKSHMSVHHSCLPGLCDALTLPCRPIGHTMWFIHGPKRTAVHSAQLNAVWTKQCLTCR